MKYLVTSLLLVLLVVRANAQITFTSDDFIANEGFNNIIETDTTTQDTAGFHTLVIMSGTGQAWNFGNRIYIQEPQTGTTTLLTYPGGAALANDPDFMASTNVVKTVLNDPTQPITYEFDKLDATGLWVLGESQDSLGIQSKALVYNPPLQEFKFPLTYQTAWQSTSSIEASYIPSGGSATESIDAVVDGYGTLLTPPSESDAALRIKQTLGITISYFGIGSTSTFYLYTWYTKSGYGANIVTDSNQTVQGANYSVPAFGFVRPELSIPDDPLSLSLSINPASNIETKLFYTLKDDGPVQVNLMDELGRSVHVLQDGHALAGRNIIPIDPKTLTAGTYFIRVVGDGMTAMRKLIITR
jgi:hypothetical protein